MPTLAYAMQKLSSATLIQRAPMPEIGAALQDVLDLLAEALPTELEESLKTFGGMVATADLEPAAHIALVCGSFVESGADPLLVFDPLLARLREALALSVDVSRVCEEMAAQGVAPEHPPAEGAGPVETYFPQLPASLTGPIRAWQSLEYLCLPAIAMLSRSPHARRTARAVTGLLNDAKRAGREHDKAGFLADMLQVLDDENLFVFHPAQEKGFWVRVKGIADNFQLHTLLADALIGDPTTGLLEGTRPDARVVAAARDLPADESTPRAHGVFEMYAWTGLRADRTLGVGSDKKQHWIRGENIPAAIPALDGFRVVLLGTPYYPRQWNPERRFPDMPASLEVLQPLDEARVQAWLKKMAARTAGVRGEG